MATFSNSHGNNSDNCVAWGVLPRGSFAAMGQKCLSVQTIFLWVGGVRALAHTWPNPTASTDAFGLGVLGVFRDE